MSVLRTAAVTYAASVRPVWPGRARCRARCEGMVLVAVLYVIGMMALVAGSLMFRVRAETAGAIVSADSDQAYLTAVSGLRRAMAIVTAHPFESSVWTDDEELFRDQLVYDDGVTQWYFTIYADNPEDRETVRYGVTDEAGKININTASAETLAALGVIDEELLPAFLDYRDTDSDVRDGGAEQGDYNNMLAFDYKIRNGSLATLEELLLVHGVHAGVVFGEDVNRNGMLEENEDDGETTFPVDNGDGQLDTGLRDKATTVSYGLDVTSSGRARTNINGDASRLGRSGLSPATIEFISLYRAEKQTFKHSSELLEMRYELTERHGNRQAGEWIESGVAVDDLPKVLDVLTAAASQGRGRGATKLAGLVNVNTAPVDVLAALPGMDMELASAIVAERAEMPVIEPGVEAEAEYDDEAGVDPAAEWRTPAWLMTRGLIQDAETFKQVAPYLTTRSYQFRVRCIGYSLPAGRFRTIEAVIDVAGKTPRITYLRDITRLGLPFALPSGENDSFE